MTGSSPVSETQRTVAIAGAPRLLTWTGASLFRGFIGGLALAVFAGVTFGIYEGVIYQPPRIWIVYQWLILGALEWALLAGFLGWIRGLLHIPLVVALQDGFSILAQGKDPITSTWHQDFFGVNVWTLHWWGLPNWYYAAALLTLILAFAASYGGTLQAAVQVQRHRRQRAA